ncbi:MAG: hypothetical protein U1D67_04260 [Dehalococcoidia bacterium]|nr:hypothetical protein [Dehalococcoidia bacterium]
MKITDYHRQLATRYYSKLINKYGLDIVLRHIPRIKEIIWTQPGLNMLERRAL